MAPTVLPWFRFRRAFVALLALVALPVASAAQTPAASFNGLPPQAFIGEPVTFTVRFDNASASATGYGPYIDLVLPAIGADGAGAPTDDGLTFVSATYLGAPVTATVLTFDASGFATHPYARDATGTSIVVSGTPGNQLVVLQLPFGSFTPLQPPVDVLVTTTLSNLADLGTPLTLQARGGFQYGADALDNPNVDPSIVGSYANLATTPTILRLRKTYIGPEDETATGPNFPRQYLIEVDIADGQTLTDLDLTDVLPSSLQFVSVNATTISGVVTGTTSISTPSTATPGGTLTRRFASVTGTNAANDATLLFTFFVPRVTGTSAVIIDPTSGDDATSIDDASTQGNWDPIDSRDPLTVSSSNITASDHVLTDKSITIQKSFTIVGDVGASGASPGDVVEYTLQVQISDYFAFQNLVVTDLLNDGLHHDATFTPTLRVTEHGSTTNANMAPANYAFVLDSPGSGTTTGTFAVSNELIARALDGVVLGGCVPAAGTGGPPPDCTSFNGAATTLTIVYRVVVQENYTDTFPSGDSSVDEGDVLSNHVTINGDVVNVATLASTGQSEADTSAADIVIVRGELFKTVYAINGSTSLPSPIRIGPGDTVTYRLQLTLPTSDVEPITITDYLPLPIFDATSVTTFDPTVSAAAPPAGQAKFGPADTFFGLSGLTPSLTSNATSNSLAFGYPQSDSPSAPSSTIDLLFTVTASDDPFADGLFLTNQATATEATTQLEPSERHAIVQIQLTEPDVRITKGVVATDAPSGVFAPTPVGPVTFSAPGSAGYRGSGSITSTNLAATPIDSNLSNVDAGDLVTFAIVLENRGTSVNGAFDVLVRDTLPTGFAVPGVGPNLQVTDGTGAPLAYATVGTGLFDAAGGIQLTDGATGALAATHATSGLNIAVITFDVEVTGSSQPVQVLTNTATVANFAGTEGGPDFTTIDRTDPATTVTIASPLVTKTIVTTNQAHTSGNNVAIGEQVQYQVVVRVPEGEAGSVTLVDTLPVGLAIVSLDGLTASSGALSASAGTFGAILGSGVVSNVGTGAQNEGRRVTLTFGTLTNSDRDDATAETITFLFTAVVIDGGSNDRGDTRTNSATFAFTGGSVSGNAPAVTIVEPTLQVVKFAAPTTGDAGDPITFTVTLSHAGGSNANAYDVALADVLPAGMTFVSATHTAGLAPTVLTPGGGFSASWTSFPTGSSSTIQIAATLDAGTSSGQVFSNTATSTWTSLPGGVTSPQSPFSSVSTERTGNPADPGGVDNDYTASGNATVTGSAAVPTKAILSTNLASTTGNDVAIGEQIQYQVQIRVPEGTHTNVTLVDTLDAGLAFASFDSLTSSSGSLSTSVPGGFPSALTSRVVANVGGGTANDGRRVTFSLGTVTNNDSDNATAETLTFVYTAVVINTAANVRGGLRNNAAVWTSDGASVNASAPDTTIVEPTLQVVKTAAPTAADAGVPITFTLTVSHTGASNAGAYDTILTDTLPSGLTYVPASATHISGTAPTTLSFAAGTLTAAYASLPLGHTSVIQFQATLDTAPPVAPGQIITNTSALVWSSLPGMVTTPQSSFNSLSTERTGVTGDPGGAANTYSASESENVTVYTSSLAGFVYRDANGDGTRGGGEPGLVGVEVRLTGIDHLGNAVNLTTTTAAGGAYSFVNLRPGTYTITEIQPAGYVDGLDTVGTPALGATAGDDTLGTITIPTSANTTGIDFNFGELASADLSVTKTGTSASAQSGGTVTYTVQVTNAGPNDAVNASLTDVLPGGTTFVSLSSPGGWSCTTPAVGATGVTRCTIAGLPAGTVTFTLTVQLDAGLAPHATLRNVATVTSDSADPNPSNNQDDEPTVVATPTEADLAVTKTDTPDPASLGQTITYTLVVTNHGPATADATVTDTLPAALAFVSATPSSGTCSATNPVVCSIPGLTAGSSATITIAAAALTSGVATNTATVAVVGPQTDPNPTNDQASEPTTIVGPGETDLAITKTGPLTVALGSQLTYTIIVTNRGPNGATDVVVDDPLALPGLTFVANAGDCVAAFPCALGALASGATRTIVSTFAVSPAYAGANPIVNTATVSSAMTDVDPTNNTDDAETRVGDPSAADLTVVKFDSPDATVAGMPITYTLVVTNNGPGTALGATVTDTLPATVTLVSATSTQGSCSGTTTVSCTLGTIANGANATIAIAVQTDSAVPTPNPIVNSATVSSTSTDPDPGNDTATQPTTIVPHTDLHITKGAPSTVTAGSALTFTIVVTNAGPSDAANVVVTDPTPTGLLFTSNTGDCTTTFPCALGTMPVGHTRTITATFAVPSGYTAPNPIVNTATVSSASAETNPANNSASTSTTLQLAADLAITKVGPATIVAGHTISYTIVVTNNGPSDAANVSVADPTPTNLAFLGNTGDCTTTFPCAFAALSAGETRTIVSTFRVPSNYTAPSSIVNTATVTSSTPDTQSANNSATATTTLGAPSADLAVTKIGPANADPGNPLVYTIAVTNSGPSDAAGVTLADPTPTGLTFLSNAGDCTTAFPCALGTLPAGQTRTITTTFMVPAGYTTPHPITNTATVSASTPDPNSANNTATALTPVGADLIVTKTVDRATPNVNDVVIFTIGLRNAGPGDATGVALVDAMPAGLTPLATTPSVGTYNAATGRWSVGPLAADASATLTLQARVDRSGALTNTATITESDQADLDTSNNTAGAALNVPAAVDLQVQKTVDRPAASVGTHVTFTITVRNAGPDAATGVVIGDAMPPGLSFVSAAPSAGTYDAATGAWTVGGLALNATATLAITATVEQEGSITNTARVTGRDQFDTAAGNDAAGVSVNGLAADLQVVKTMDQSAPRLGDRVTFTLVVTNNGPGEATSVRVGDVLPPGLAFVSTTASQGLYVPETGVWTVGALATPGSGGVSAATLQIVTTVVSAGAGANVARVVGGDQPDPNPANDAAGAAFDTGTADLEAGLTYTGDGDAVGRLFDFFVSVTNRGGRAVQEPVTVAIPFPAELVFSAPQSNWPCEAIGRTLFCEHELSTPLNQNQSVSLAYWADVLRVFPRGLAAYAHVGGAYDAQVGNNVGTVLVTPPVTASADLQVTQTIASPASGVGSTVTYRAELINAGPNAATDVTFIDMLPEGLTLVSIASEVGTCAGTRRLACALGTIAAEQRVGLTITARLDAIGLIAHTVSVSGREADANLANNAAQATFSLASAPSTSRDSDADGLPDIWESQMGLNPGLADAALDPDGDGLTNAQEYERHSHPRGFHRQFFAEGVANDFFDTTFSLVNPSATRDALVALEAMRDTGEVTTTMRQMGAMSRADVPAREMLGARLGAFSTVLESDRPVAIDRMTWWDAHRYGTALETGLPSPSTRWLFAEGATHGFQMFLLLENPDMTQAADVTVRYLLPSGAPIVKTYQVAAHSRVTIYVNEIPELAATDLSTEILSTRPIVAERAMYRGTAGQMFASGHVASGATAPSPTWFFAEGATGEFFNLYLLLGNPNASASTVDVRYLLPDGQTIVKSYQVGGNTRRTIDVASEDPRLGATTIGLTVEASLPIVAERAMWWPGPRVAPGWYESHVVLGATEAGTRWAVASGAAGGVLAEQTFVLVANQASTAGRLRVTVVLDDGRSLTQELPIAATARVTLDIASLFPDAANHMFSTIVESVGASPVPIIVEGARYASPDGQLWGAGAAALATKLP